MKPLFKFGLIKHERADMLHEILSSTPLYIFILNADGKLLYANRVFTERFGMGVAGLLGRSIFDFGMTADAEKNFEENRRRTLESTKAVVGEATYTVFNTRMDFEYTISPLPETHWSSNTTLVTARDITGRKQTEQRYTLLVEAAQEYAIFSLDKDGLIQTWNKGAKRIKGYDREEIIGKHFSIFYPQEDRANNKPKRALAQAVREGKFEEEGLRVRKDGSLFWAQVTITPLFDNENTIVGFSKITRDISRRKENEASLQKAYDEMEQRVIERTVELQTINQALQKSELALRELSEAMPQIVWTAGPGGLIDYYNVQWFEYTNLTPEQSLNGQGRLAVIHPDDFPRVVAAWEQAVRSGQTYETEYRMLRGNDQKYYWHLDRAVSVRNPEGTISQWIGTITDIDERKRYESELQKAKEQFEIILGNVGDAITAQKNDGTIIYANDIAAQLIGFSSAEELLSVSTAEIMDRFEMTDESGRPLSSMDLPGRLALQGKTPQETTLCFRIKATGKLRWAKVKARPVFDAEGKVILAVNIFRDITAERFNELSLRRSEELQRFLSTASEILGSSLDYRETLRNIASIIVPKFADWCTVDMVTPEGSLSRLAVAHVDPKKVQWAVKLARTNTVDMNASTGVPNVIRTGKPEFYPYVSEEMIVTGGKNQQELELLRKLKLGSIIIVPVKSGKKTLGVITLAQAESARHYDQKDLEFAEELARRASLAIENSQLYEEASALAQKEHEESTLLETLLGNAPIGFVFFDSNLKIVRANHAMGEMNGMKASALIGQSMADTASENSKKLEPVLREVMRTGKPVLNLEISGDIPRQPGKTHHWVANYYPVPDMKGTIIGIGGVISEVTEQKKYEETIRHQAMHDVLTGLPNRKAMEDRLEQAIAMADRNNEMIGVMFLDLDRFKKINDTLGHTAGDDFLRKAAARLLGSVRKEDTVSRFGGDEFVILLQEIKSAEDAIKIAEKVLASLQPIIETEHYALHVSASLGIALYPYDGTDAHSLLKNADTALYRAKEAGRNTFQLYNQTMSVQSSEKLVLESNLRHALEQDEMLVFYQPVMDMLSGKIVAVEALLRWQHPKLGLMLPHEFIQMAEETGDILPIGKWLLQKVSHQAAEWQKKHHTPPLRMAVNLSARQFMQPGLAITIADILRDSGLESDLLELELTESIAMQNIDFIVSKCRELRSLGVQITIDDFGTGYSSLNYLKEFPINKLKIDKSFVRHCITEPQDSAIIRAIISMAHSLNLKVVAEGVETETQLRFLSSLQCDLAQGFYIGYPMSPPEFVRWYRDNYSSGASKF